MASMRRRSFSRSKEDNTPPSEQIVLAQAQAKAKEERRNDAARRFSLTGMVDLAEFANVMSNAKEKGLRVDQIFKYFKSEGAGDDDDITPDDFEAAMKKLGWSISAGEARGIYAGQKPLWKSKQFLTLKIGYEKTLKVLAVSAKDADDTVFAPLFVDAALACSAGATSKAPWRRSSRPGRARDVAAPVDGGLQRDDRGGRRGPRGAASERARGVAAMERLRKSLDAFTIKHAKPFRDMDNAEKLKFLLVRFSFKHMVNKVTHRLNHSKVRKAMLAEQAAKKRNYGRRPSLGDL
ncbi:hypothetical protein SO694_00206019 [Aureococcus anophagefferens]|uniref:EF-hand domain-containing protein n=1 Tax=Aureococcus anophagefferens TaxID=44056 RepID=A0ABR1FNR7_AURAN